MAKVICETCGENWDTWQSSDCPTCHTARSEKRQQAKAALAASQEPALPPEIAAQAKRLSVTARILGAIGFIFITLSLYNVLKGLNAFGSIPFLIEAGIGLGCAIPAYVLYRQRVNLEERALDASINKE